MTDLQQHIQALPLVDTHEHLYREDVYLQDGPDVLQDLFQNYIEADLVVAGATSEAVARLTNADDTDVVERFAGIREAWETCQYSGYGEAVRLIARRVYGMDEITPEALLAAHERNLSLRRPGERLRILKEVGNLDHVQIDNIELENFHWDCSPDLSGPDFFLYDLSWRAFSNGELNVEAIYREVNVEIANLETLREAMAAIFARHAPCAIAVKSQLAYQRTLCWQERDDVDAERVLKKYLAGQEITTDERLCFGDWCWARGVELAIRHNLPFKIHTGYLAGHSYMPLERLNPAHLCDLLRKYPSARFVLMHIAYPYNNQLVAIAKHFPNVYVDMCWAWSIDPYSARDFVRRMIHTVPINKLFAFGGDTRWPNAAVAYATQARQWLTRALQGEIDDGLLLERQAIALATRLMRTNQTACFDLEGTRAAIRAAARV